MSERPWDVAFGLGLLFVASLARVVGAVVQGETFGAEPSLALLVVLASAAWAIKFLAQAPEG
jgi:hypothetical protein